MKEIFVLLMKDFFMNFLKHNALIPWMWLALVNDVGVAKWEHRTQPDKYYQHLIIV